MLRERLERVRERIRLACERCGRPASAVTLVGVTKTVPLDAIRDAVALGLTDLGENRVQEAHAKQQALGIRSSEFGIQSSESIPHSEFRIPNSVRWHLIGHLQRNKAKLAVELFDVIHSVDSPALVEALERAQGSRLKAEGKNVVRPLHVLIQVNVSGEAAKFGCRPEEARAVADAIRRVPSLTLAGLMTIAPFSESPEATRPHFRRLRHLRDELAAAFSLEPLALSLSMGMSQDFEVAIEEGADIIRVGTAMFGSRDSQNSEFGIQSAE